MTTETQDHDIDVDGERGGPAGPELIAWLPPGVAGAIRAIGRAALRDTTQSEWSHLIDLGTVLAPQGALLKGGLVGKRDELLHAILSAAPAGREHAAVGALLHGLAEQRASTCEMLAIELSRAVLGVDFGGARRFMDSPGARGKKKGEGELERLRCETTPERVAVARDAARWGRPGRPVGPTLALAGLFGRGIIVHAFLCATSEQTVTVSRLVLGHARGVDPELLAFGVRSLVSRATQREIQWALDGAELPWAARLGQPPLPVALVAPSVAIGAPEA